MENKVVADYMRTSPLWRQKISEKIRALTYKQMLYEKNKKTNSRRISPNTKEL